MPTKKATPAVSKKSKVKKIKELPCAFGEQCFWVHNGPVLSNLIELRDALRDISDEMYAHHVQVGKNDFADWAQHVLTEDTLAKALRKAEDKNEAYMVVLKYLKSHGI